MKQNRKKRLIIACVLIAALSAGFGAIAVTQISLDSPASLPSDI